MNKLINTNAKEGDKVIFIGEDCYSIELEYAKKKLEIGKEYTVLYTITSEFQATVCLEELPADDFDTYMFIDADKADKYMIEYLCNNYQHIGLIEEEAELVLHEIKDIIPTDKLIQFVQDDLCIFRSAKKAFEWFNDGRRIDMSNIEFDITEDMVGKEIIEVLLENKENYIKMVNGMHLTWWM